MFTNHMLIQKINENIKFEQFFASSSNIIWRFLERKRLSKDRTDIFPFEVDYSVNFKKADQGRETKLIEYKEKQMFKFVENYAVPNGMVIAIVLPKKYVPISMNFGEKSIIPIDGEVKSQPPGYLEVLYNPIEKQCTIIFTIISQTNFQFSCIAGYREGNFPSALNNYQVGTVSATIAANSIGNNSITNKDLMNFKDYFKDNTDFSKIASALNELKELVKTNSLDSEKEGIVKKTIMKALSDSINTSSALTTLLDSYKNGGIVSKAIVGILLSFTS